MASDLPNERDFDPFGGVDEQCAWRHFGGLNLEEAYEKFANYPEIYQEDFMFMGGNAFAFYYPVIDRYLRMTIELPKEKRGDRQSWILPQCIRSQFEGTHRRDVAPLKQSVLDLCVFMLQHMEYFVGDWDDPAEIEKQWRLLQDHARQCTSP